jgi:hypothetical protein
LQKRNDLTESSSEGDCEYPFDKVFLEDNSKDRRGRLYEGYYFSHTACPFIFFVCQIRKISVVTDITYEIKVFSGLPEW